MDELILIDTYLFENALEQLPYLDEEEQKKLIKKMYYELERAEFKIKHLRNKLEKYLEKYEKELEEKLEEELEEKHKEKLKIKEIIIKLNEEK